LYLRDEFAHLDSELLQLRLTLLIERHILLRLDGEGVVGDVVQVLPLLQHQLLSTRLHNGDLGSEPEGNSETKKKK
jgi:hypothetical protein